MRRVRYLILVPVRGQAPRLHAGEVTWLVRFMAVSVGVLAMLTGAVAVAIVLWDAFGTP